MNEIDANEVRVDDKLLLQEAKDGNPHSMYLYAKSCLENEENYSESIYWYTEASENKHAASKYELALIYRDGISINGYVVEKDIEKSISLLRESARLDHEDAQYELSKIYYEGNNIKRNTYKAAYWMEKCYYHGSKKAWEYWKKYKLWEYMYR